MVSSGCFLSPQLPVGGRVWVAEGFVKAADPIIRALYVVLLLASSGSTCTSSFSHVHLHVVLPLVCMLARG
jgi:hypothetical protein